ncbi:hypothetical protein DFO45_4912 [Azorhizobium sp. AG788]|nr:hypothetical protein DFO45_4912 [Azorhizobium sp. AG788]
MPRPVVPPPYPSPSRGEGTCRAVGWVGFDAIRAVPLWAVQRTRDRLPPPSLEQAFDPSAGVPRAGTFAK